MSLRLPAQDDGCSGASVVGGQGKSLQERISLSPCVLQGGPRTQRLLGAIQNVPQEHGFPHEIEDRPIAKQAVDTVNGAMHAAHYIIHVNDAGASGDVRGDLDCLRAAALARREQGAEIGAPDPACAAVHLGRTDDGDVEHVTGGENGLLMGRTPAHCGGRLTLGEGGARGHGVGHGGVLVAVHPGARDVDEAELGACGAFFGEGGDARLGGGGDGTEDGAGGFVGGCGINHDVDGDRGDEMGEAVWIGDVANDGDDLVLGEGLGFGRGTGEAIDDVIAGTEEGFGEREAKIARGAKDEDSRHGDWRVFVLKEGEVDKGLICVEYILVLLLFG